MNLIAVSPQETLDLGSGFTFETAYDLVFANDTEENPWLPGYEIILVDGEDRYVFATGCWEQI
jgi:hypothetical protein